MASAIATNEADLAAATKIRDQEAADFTAQEKELSEVTQEYLSLDVVLELSRVRQNGGKEHKKNAEEQYK